MRAGEVIAVGPTDELGVRGSRPAGHRSGLPAGWSLGGVPEVPSQGRSLEGDRLLVLTAEPVVAGQRITT